MTPPRFRGQSHNQPSMEGITTDTELLQLPHALLLSVLQRLDFWSVCAASRTCSLLFQLAAHPSIHPNSGNGSCVEWDVRSVLARTLRLPPQAFCVQELDAKRSRRWPVTVPLHNLRTILGITDVEALAERVSIAVQAHAAKVQAWKYSSWRQLPPVSVIRVCRADRGTVRASLRPEAVVPAVLQQLQQLGWPPLAAPDTAAAAAAAPSTLPDIPTSAAAVMHDCLQVCHARLAAGLVQLSGGVSGSGPGGTSPTEPRDQLALSRAPAAHASTTAAARHHLPDSSTARQAALSQLAGLADHTTAEQLAPAAVRVLYVAAAADPGSCSFAAAGRPGWLLLMQQAVKLVLRRHLLQRDCSATAPDWEHAWRLAATSELQLCLAGLLHFPPRCLSPAAVYHCAVAVEAAAAEYAGSGSSTELLAGLSITDEHQAGPQEALRQACQVETLRVLQWCLWLLGVGGGG